MPILFTEITNFKLYKMVKEVKRDSNFVCHKNFFYLNITKSSKMGNW